jgi:phosphate transport system protein
MRIREHFDRELAALQVKLRELGLLVAQSVARTIDALGQNDHALAQRVITEDTQINQAQYAIEALAAHLIATQQPVAGDMRRLLSAITIAGELERIADYAKRVAKLTLGEDRTGASLHPSPELLQLADAARSMLGGALAAIAGPEPAAARRVGAADDRVDALYREVRTGIIASLQASPSDAARIADLLAVAHTFERIGDRATNIAERVIYSSLGEVVALNP